MYKGLLLLVSILIIACGADEEAAFEVSDKAPVVSLSKVAQEITDDGLKITFKVVSDSSPKTDVLVKILERDSFFDFSSQDLRACDSKGIHSPEFWVTLPKGKKESQVIEETYQARSLNGCTGFSILPLPIIDIVGEGEMIDQALLQRKYGGRKTREGKVIPKDFVFPYYEVENPDGVNFYCPKPAKIVSVDPPDGSVIPWETITTNLADIKVTFDTPPECPGISTSFDKISFSGSGTTFSINIRTVGFIPINSVVQGGIEIIWGPKDSENSELRFYTIHRK